LIGKAFATKDTKTFLRAEARLILPFVPFVVKAFFA